jgi:hypothetical protein
MIRHVLVLGMLATLFWGAPPFHISPKAQASVDTTDHRHPRPPNPPAPPLPPPTGLAANSITIANASVVAITNYPLQFGRPFVDGAIADQPQVLISGSPVTTQADVKKHYPDGSAEFAVIAVVVPTLPASGSLTLTFRNQVSGTSTPLTQAQMLGPAYNFDAAATFTPAAGGAPTAVSARAMLTAGDCKPWTQGPVAQTMICADDTAARKYDVGFGDGFHPVRPRFYATFWPATHQVAVRAVGESGLTTEYEDAAYQVTITAGQSVPVMVYSADLSGTQSTNPKLHWAGSAWTQRFWLGGTPSAEVNIDNNLAYLTSTRFLPHYDAATQLTSAAIAAMAALWTGMPHDLYDGVWDGGVWQNAMGTSGARYDIGPYPTWTALWLYTGDWRLRQMALGMADLAAAWPYHARETDPTRILNHGDAVGSGTSLGLPFSIVGRPGIDTWNSNGTIGDAFAVVGPVSANPWSYESSHEPAAFYPQYLLTGDPWYLGEIEFLANWDAGRYPPGNCAYCQRGPDGTYGGIGDEVRGAGWVIRSRAEAAFAVPDGDPEKTYLETLVNDALARWEGGFGITGTVYDGTLMKNWGAGLGNYYTLNAGPNSTKVPPLHYWDSNGKPTTDNSLVDSDTAAGWFVPGAVGSITNPWMLWYTQYCLGRAAELGFASGPLAQWTGQFLTGLINNSGLPIAITVYEAPAEVEGGGFPATYAAWLALFTSSANSATNQYLSCSGTMPSGQLCLQDYFAANLYAQGRPAYAMAALAPLVDEGAAGATQAWTWLDTNVRRPIAAATEATSGPPWSEDPSWDIVPRTDTNVLPTQPTARQ